MPTCSFTVSPAPMPGGFVRPIGKLPAPNDKVGFG